MSQNAYENPINFSFINTPLDAQKSEIPRDKLTNDHKSRFLLNSCARNALLCALSQEEYSKVYSSRTAKQVRYTLAITYEGSSEVKRKKLINLTCKYELFNIEEGEDIQTMFGRFQTIMNELCSLGRHYDNYDHIDKIL